MKCQEHQDEAQYFCKYQLCINFLKLTCLRCNTQCQQQYHLEEIDEYQKFKSEYKLPKPNIQWDYCNQLMDILKQQRQDLHNKIVYEYNQTIQELIKYIQIQSQSQLKELEEQFKYNDDSLNDRFQEFNKLYQISKDLDKQINIEDSDQRLKYLQDYQILEQMQADLEIVIQEVSVETATAKQLKQTISEVQDLKPYQNIIDNALNIIWGQYYNIIENNARNSSIAESEALVNMVRKSRNNTQIIEDVNFQQLISSFEGQKKSFSFNAQNLSLICQLNIGSQKGQLNIEKASQITPYCLIAIKNTNLIITGGDSNEIYQWVNENNKWRLSSLLQLCQEQIFVQALELVYSPSNESRNSRQSFASLRVLIHNIIAVAGGQNIFLVQIDSLNNNMTLLNKLQIKENIITLCQLQSLGYYNYFIAGLDIGQIYCFNYIVSIEGSYTIRLDQVAKLHQDVLTSIETVDNYILVASNDRSISMWTFVNAKLKLLPTKLNRFWEDITSIRYIKTGLFITSDCFNIILWQIEQDQSVKVINQVQIKQKMEVHELVIINSQDSIDFLVLVLAKKIESKQKTNYKLILYDKNLKQIIENEQLNLVEFQSSIHIQKGKKKQHYITNDKIRIVSEIRNKIDLRQSRTFSDIHNQQIIIVILNNLKTGKHFVEYTLKIGD